MLGSCTFQLPATHVTVRNKALTVTKESTGQLHSDSLGPNSGPLNKPPTAYKPSRISWHWRTYK